MNTLPHALRPLRSFRQFINWIPVPKDSGKVDKLPVSPYTGVVCDAHDPVNHASFEDAARTGKNVAFVLTDRDPFFFIDIDNALDQNNVWSDDARAICADFAGCAVEVSQSLHGLHIIGTQGPDTPCACEQRFYKTRRFIALTGINVVGDAAYTPPAYAGLLQKYFPVNSQAVKGGWSSSPVSEWTGETDDTALISKMLESTTAYKNSASIQALWTADDIELSVYFPSQSGEAFDHSRADAALCSHLAFWTGKNCERIDTLFRQSALMREKWERVDYRTDTILKAAGACKRVYDVPRPNDPVGPTFLGDIEQREYFKDCVYVQDHHAVLCSGGVILTPDRFKTTFSKGALFQIGEKYVKNAWAAFTENPANPFKIANSLSFFPKRPPMEITETEGITYVNSYVPSGVVKRKGDCTVFLNHLRKLFPDDNDRAIITAYLAACVQYPGTKFRWCPVIQGTFGNGKSIITDFVSYAVGYRYTHKPNSQDLTNKFTGWIAKKLLIIIEEISIADKTDALEFLKRLVTEERIEIQAKGVDQYTGYNTANLFILSNHKNGIYISESDRRFAVFYTPQQTKIDLLRDGLTPEYFYNLVQWQQSGGNAHVADFLDSYAIPDALNPAKYSLTAPQTTSTAEAVEISLRGTASDTLSEAVDEERPGFKNGWISSIKVTQLYPKLTSTARNKIIHALGYVKHPGLSDGRCPSPVFQEGGKPRLYVKSGSLLMNLTNPNEIQNRYMKDQEYSVNEGALKCK